MMRLDLATAEYIGARAQQQDLAAAMPLASGAGAVLVLADGLGGHESGADASRIVVETFREAAAGGRFNNAQTRRQALRETVDRANARIAEGVDPAHGHRGMASTVVAAVVSHGELSWVSVGDSHLYVWRGGRLHKLNEDHSQAGLMVRSGQYQPSDPEVQAVKSVLVSALTGRKLEIVDLPQKTFRLEPGDVLMLASDGLNTLPDTEIEGIVADVRGQGAVKLSTTLLERVRSRRLERQDNTTVAIARVLEPPQPEAIEVIRKPAVSEPARKPDFDEQRRPQPEHQVSLDDTSEARTERVVPAPAGAERVATSADATMPAPRPEPALAEPSQVEDAAPESMRLDSQSAPTDQDARQSTPSKDSHPAEAARPAELETEAKSAPSAVELPSPPPKPVLATPEVRAPAPPSHRARPAQAPASAAAPSAPAPAQASAASRARHVGSLGQKTQSFEHRSTSKSGLSRVLIAALLVALIAVGFAIAAMAALRPHWLSGIVPGFGITEVIEPQRENAAPAASDPKPAAAPQPSSVPTIRPVQDSNARPDAAETQRSPAGPPKAVLPPTPTEEATKAAADPVASAKPAVAAPAEAKDGAALQSGDPPLVEPQRPAKAPPAKQKRNNTPPAN